MTHIVFGREVSGSQKSRSHTPCGASRAAVMLAWYRLCLSRGMDTRLWSPGPPETSTPRSTSLGFHRASPLSSFHSDMLSFPLWCWRVPGSGNTPCMLWRFALVIHLSSSSLFATHLMGPATPLQKSSTKMQDNTKMSLGVLHGGAGFGDGFGMQCFLCFRGSFIPVWIINASIHLMSSLVVCLQCRSTPGCSSIPSVGRMGRHR
jgi:hypothetical protein